MKFIVRVDDFPWNVEHKKDENNVLFKKFYGIIYKYDVKIMLGVIPAFCYKEDIEYLKTLKNTEIALHGYDHSGISYVNGEFTGIDRREKENKISSGLKILKDFKVQCFIPPYNYYDKELLDILGEHNLKYIMDKGEYGIRKLHNKMLSVSSEDILYDKAFQILKIFDKLNLSIDVIKAITLHCTWEYQNLNTGDLELLCKKLSGKTIFMSEYKNRNLPDYSDLPIATRLSYQWILDRVGQGNIVLDIGSLDSMLPVLLSIKGNRVTSVDRDERVLRYHKELMKEYKIKYTVIQSDARKLKNDSETFDIVTASHSVQHSMDDDKLVVKELHRVLKKGGRLLLVAAYTSNASYIWKNRKDPMRVNNLDDIYKRFIIPNQFSVLSIDFYGYDYAKNTGSWVTASKANAVCLELLK